MGAATPFSKLKRPDDPRPTGGLAQYMFAKDDVDSLSRARQGYVKNTGGKLGDVRNAGIYKNFTEAQKKEYRKRNPQDFEEEEEEKKGYKLGKRSLLGE